MMSKRFSQKKLDKEQKQREIRKAQINQAIEAAMTTFNGSRRESFNAVDLAVKLKTIDVDYLYRIGACRIVESGNSIIKHLMKVLPI